MTCICQARQLSENSKTHSQACDDYNARLREQQLRERVAWETQKEPCSGSGYAHPPHGACPGYTYDRT